LIYPIPDVKLVIPDFPIPDHWPRAYGLDIHWNRLAAIWGARDPQSDVLYLFGEYDAEADSALHAATIRSRGDWIVGLMDPKAHGRNQADGYQLMQRYINLGLLLEAVSNPLESGILEVWQRMQSGSLKVFGSLSRYLQERRLYRKDENDQVVPDHDSPAERNALLGEWNIEAIDSAKTVSTPDSQLWRCIGLDAIGALIFALQDGGNVQFGVIGVNSPTVASRQPLFVNPKTNTTRKSSCFAPVI
jgi:hypothetical protein